jgi:hypothetical protein
VVKILNDERNLRNLEKLAKALVPEGSDSSEIFECLQSAYKLGKSEGRLEQTLERVNELERANG